MADVPDPLGFSFDDALDDAAARLARGESLDSVLRAYPEHANTLRAPLSALQPILALPFVAPSQQSSINASRSMFASLDAAKPRRASMFAGVWAALGARHMRFQAAAAGIAVVFFGGLGLASAAGDRSPVPVPQFLRVLSTSSDSTVMLRGTIVSVDPVTLVVHTTNGDQALVIEATTEVRVGNVLATVADLAPGQSVTVRASHGMGGTLRAGRIAAIAATAPITATASPVPDLAPGIEVTTATPTDNRDDDSGGVRTPESIEPGNDSDGHDVATPDSGEDDGSEHGISGPSATPGVAGGDDDGHETATQTPSPGSHVDPTEAPHESHSPEPTERPEPTEKPEPTEAH